MALSNPFSTKTDDLSVVTAAEFNNAGVYISRAIDGVGGGTYTPTAPIDIAGSNGIRIASTGFLTVQSGGTLTFASGSAVTGTLAIAATTTASDFTMSGTNKVKLASRSITRTQAVMPSPTSATWTINAQGFAVQAANNTDKLIWPLRVPHGATLTNVDVALDAAGGHGGAPTMPSVEVGYISTLGFVSLASKTDATSLVSYQLFHAFGIDPISHTVDRSNRRYVAIITGESGGNYVAGLTIYYVTCTYTITEYDED